LKIHLHEFETVKVDVYQWEASCRGCLILGKERIRGWVGPTAGVDAAGKKNISCCCRGSNYLYSESVTFTAYVCTRITSNRRWTLQAKRPAEDNPAQPIPHAYPPTQDRYHPATGTEIPICTRF